MNPQPTSPISALSFAKAIWQKANDGEISQMALNEGMQAIADTQFGGSMSKMLESNIGKEFLKPRTHRAYAAATEVDLPKAEGRAYDTQNSNDAGVPHVGENSRGRRNQTGANVNAPTHADEVNRFPVDSDRDDEATKTARAIRVHMDRNGGDYDKAVSTVLAAQKAARGW
jgi:hypothetical protein